MGVAGTGGTMLAVNESHARLEKPYFEAHLKIEQHTKVDPVGGTVEGIKDTGGGLVDGVKDTVGKLLP
jgi:hypothetical protein